MTDIMGGIIIGLLTVGHIVAAPVGMYLHDKTSLARIKVLSDRITVNLQTLGGLRNRSENKENGLRNWSVLCFLSGAVSGICKYRSEDSANHIYAYVLLGTLSVFSFVKAIFSLKEMNRIEDERKKVDGINTLALLERRGQIDDLYFNWECVKQHD